MKKRLMTLILALSIISIPIIVNASVETYDDSTYSFDYDSDAFFTETTEDGTVRIKAYNMPDCGEGHNTVLACMNQVNTSYNDLGELSDSDLNYFKRNFVQGICTGLFDIDPGISVTSDSFSYKHDSCEYRMTLSDGTECYTTLYNYGEVLHYSVCRLCPYSSDLNDDFRNIYQSIKLSANDEPMTELQTEIKIETETEFLAETESDPITEKETDAVQDDALIDGFRDIKWGTDLEDVKSAIITDDMIEEKDYGFADNRLIVMNSSVAGYSAITGYCFDNNSKLNQGMYVITEEHTNKTDYYEDYCDLVELYTEKYGKPAKTLENWKNDLYKDSPQDIGLAISIGHVEFAKLWTDDLGAKILISLTGDNFKIKLGIVYDAPDYIEAKDTSGI